jgi:hypothetical protein
MTGEEDVPSSFLRRLTENMKDLTPEQSRAAEEVLREEFASAKPFRPGRRVTRAEAIDIVDDVLETAERERSECAERDARETMIPVISMSRRELILATRMTHIEEDGSLSYNDMPTWQMNRLIDFLRQKGVEVAE